MILVFGGDGQLGRELSRAAARRYIALTALSHARADIGDQDAVAGVLNAHTRPGRQCRGLHEC